MQRPGRRGLKRADRRPGQGSGAAAADRGGAHRLDLVERADLRQHQPQVHRPDQETRPPGALLLVRTKAPVACCDEHRQYVWAFLDPESASGLLLWESRGVAKHSAEEAGRSTPPPEGKEPTISAAHAATNPRGPCCLAGPRFCAKSVETIQFDDASEKTTWSYEKATTAALQTGSRLRLRASAFASPITPLRLFRGRGRVAVPFEDERV